MPGKKDKTEDSVRAIRKAAKDALRHEPVEEEMEFDEDGFPVFDRPAVGFRVRRKARTPGDSSTWKRMRT